MKYNKTILTILFLCFANICFADSMPVDGVSKDLVQLRKKTINSVVYDLYFNVPDNKEEPVVGNVIINVNVSDTQNDLVLDFQCDRQSLPKSMIVNGKEHNIVAHNEHIIIDKQFLTKGDNQISITQFIANDKTLNRHDDYLYTLFVPDHARSVFPCFDQPDIKARFTLSLLVPQGWKAISNGKMTHHKLEKVHETRPKAKPCMKESYRFATSDLLPTYLFSFTAGVFESQQKTIDSYEIEGLYRKQSPEREAQLATVFDEIALSLRWMENYTGIRQPFQKYGFVVLPGYQFGGMEHPGAIQLNELRIFLRQNPTDDEELSRLNLLAHETAHLWFGDLVTMKWFDDVWTKEVYANFFADKIAQRQFPYINHTLNFVKSHYPLAFATDRSEGSHPIQQSLDNLNRAGLLYGNIIYHKAPIMMQKLEELTGEENMQTTLRDYLKRYSYGNATWDDLIDCFTRVCPDINVSEFSRVWVKERGIPLITLDEDNMKFIQHDPDDKGRQWQQTIKAEAVGGHIIPNSDGKGYGRFLIEDGTMKFILSNWKTFEETTRLAAIMMLYENFLMHRIGAATLFSALADGLWVETNQLVASSALSYMQALLPYLANERLYDAELQIVNIAQTHSQQSVRLQAKRALAASASSNEARNYIYGVWAEGSDHSLTERDFMEMSYRLCQLMPFSYDSIVSVQRERLSSIDIQREFDFVVGACSPDVNKRRAMFEELLVADNRRVEPWAASRLRLLNSRLYGLQPTEYITPALDALEDIQRTGDIFFPSDWTRALLTNHYSMAAKKSVETWIATHDNISPTLMNKLKEAAYHLHNMSEDVTAN